MSTVKRIISGFPLGWVREIPREAGRYLTRYSVRRQERGGGGGYRCYLHRFWDHDVELHDHPWRWSFSIVLWGSYTEHYFDTECMVAHTMDRCAGCSPDLTRAGPIRERRVRWFNWIPANRYHQITELHPRAGRVWTLFFCGPLHGQSWGFWVPGRGWVKHTERKKERGLPTL